MLPSFVLCFLLDCVGAAKVFVGAGALVHLLDLCFGLCLIKLSESSDLVDEDPCFGWGLLRAFLLLLLCAPFLSLRFLVGNSLSDDRFWDVSSFTGGDSRGFVIRFLVFTLFVGLRVACDPYFWDFSAECSLLSFSSSDPGELFVAELWLDFDSLWVLLLSLLCPRFFLLIDNSSSDDRCCNVLTEGVSGEFMTACLLLDNLAEALQLPCDCFCDLCAEDFSLSLWCFRTVSTCSFLSLAGHFWPDLVILPAPSSGLISSSAAGSRKSEWFLSGLALTLLRLWRGALTFLSSTDASFSPRIREHSFMQHVL